MQNSKITFMSTGITYPIAKLRSIRLTLRITETECTITNTLFSTTDPIFQKVLKKLSIVVDDDTTKGIPVDICYYWWEFENNLIEEATQREVALRKFNENIDYISDSWLLNQDSFFVPISSDDKIPHPLIHIPYRDVSSKEVLLKHFPRYANIMDDSIWNYLLIWDKNVKENFDKIVSQIRKNAFVDKYYYLSVAQEYAHLNARMLREAFILNKGGKNHGAYISPFLFHSKTSLKQISTEEISKFKWRFLLLDDKIDKDDEEGTLSSTNPTLKLTKSEILKNRISQLNIGKCNCVLVKNTDFELPVVNDCQIQIVCVDTIEKAIKLMHKYEFDIILLDYLLKDNYGYKLLTLLSKENIETQNVLIGPQKKNFFMFISAFTTAVNERLTLEGLSRDEDWWLIGEGACPTNTPELFNYRLVHLMERRLVQTGIKDLTYNNILNTVQKIYIDNHEEIGENNKNQRIRSVRKRAYEAYHEILGFHYDYYFLQEKDKGNSVLVDSFLEKQVHFGAMLEHLLQLVHLTAFGTVRQWPEIWEEYQFFSRTVNDSSKYATLMNKITKSIESHIIDLKSE